MILFFFCFIRNQAKHEKLCKSNFSLSKLKLATRKIGMRNVTDGLRVQVFCLFFFSTYSLVKFDKINSVHEHENNNLGIILSFLFTNVSFLQTCNLVSKSFEVDYKTSRRKEKSDLINDRMT